jgi:hypothetical protein
MVCQCFPELAVDERYDAAGVFWCAAVILAMIDISMVALENAWCCLMGKTDLAYLPPLLLSILPHLRMFVSCRVVAAYLPEATDVVLDVAWDPEIWLERV